MRELAERCDILGIPLRTEGELCVDRCCDFRKTLNVILPGLSVVQDCMHVEGRIMSTVAKDSPARSYVGQELSKALIRQRSDGKGNPSLYWEASEQVKQLQEVQKTFAVVGGVWTEASVRAFQWQIKHAANGCLQRRHPSIPSHTSGNENWHSHINGLTHGDASSLTTLVALLADAVLRFNLKVKIYSLSQPSESPSRMFRAATNGSHWIFLIHSMLRKREDLYGSEQPKFLDICPEHHFGLVSLESE